MKDSLRSVLIGIRNLIRWLPTIWKDRDWDYDFALDILKRKMHLMHAFFTPDKTHLENALDVARSIENALALLSNYQKDDYHLITCAEAEKRWGDGKLTFVPYDGRHDEMIIVYQLATNDDEQELAQRDWSECLRRAYELQQQDWVALWKIISDSMQTWWD